MDTIQHTPCSKQYVYIHLIVRNFTIFSITVGTLSMYKFAITIYDQWAKLLKAFLVEAKWFHSRKCPKAEEYLKNGKMSSGVQLVLIHLFFLLGHGLTKRNVDLLDGDNPPIISSVAKILRLCDDLSAMVCKLNYRIGFFVCPIKLMMMLKNACRTKSKTSMMGLMWIAT